MAKPAPPSREDTTTPAAHELPQITPPTYAGSDYSFVLQSVFEIQRALGAVEKAVSTLTDELKDQRKILNWISRVIWFTAGGIVLAGGLVGYILDKGFDRLLEVLMTK